MLNIKKRKIMLFGTRKRIKNQMVRLTFKDNVIEVVDIFKYICVIFDNCLNCDIHLSETTLSYCLRWQSVVEGVQYRCR